jgi:hypothetical protein
MMSWITESAKRGKKLQDAYNIGGTPVFIKDRLPDNVNFDFVVKYIESRVPYRLMKGMDIIYIGQFEEFKRRDINAYFEDGALYISNEQDDEMDLIDDIVHEMAHSVEREFGGYIYTGRIEKEFEAKRRRLYDMLKTYGYGVSPVFKVKMEYDKEIDEFLYKEVGYEALGNLVNGLFPSPYSVTSLREYFAMGFEEYFLGDLKYLKKVSPTLYSVIDSLMED